MYKNTNYTYNDNPLSLSKTKKIALCFLIYDKINHEKLWYRWLEHINPNKYTIYIQRRITDGFFR